MAKTKKKYSKNKKYSRSRNKYSKRKKYSRNKYNKKKKYKKYTFKKRNQMGVMNQGGGAGNPKLDTEPAPEPEPEPAPEEQKNLDINSLNGVAREITINIDQEVDEQIANPQDFEKQLLLYKNANEICDVLLSFGCQLPPEAKRKRNQFRERIKDIEEAMKQSRAPAAPAAEEPVIPAPSGDGIKQSGGGMCQLEEINNLNRLKNNIIRNLPKVEMKSMTPHTLDHTNKKPTNKPDKPAKPANKPAEPAEPVHHWAAELESILKNLRDKRGNYDIDSQRMVADYNNILEREKLREQDEMTFEPFPPIDDSINFKTEFEKIWRNYKQQLRWRNLTLGDPGSN